MFLKIDEAYRVVMMAGKFQWYKFSEVNLDDPFFDFLKEDYPEFPIWFSKKSFEDEQAMVFYDDEGIGAFIYLKKEDEPIRLTDRELPSCSRLKIGTFRLAERFRGQRLGEGALGVSLWKWQETKRDEIYVTVYDKHKDLISLFERFGFNKIGINERGESVYLKSRNELNYSDAYKSFPFISPNFEKAGLLPIYEFYHDLLFPYSELKGNKIIEEETAGNGITKVYIATPFSKLSYYVGEPVGIYRIFNGDGKKYRSAVTSFCTITNLEVIKAKNKKLINATDFIKKAGNKTIYSPEELFEIYEKNPNVVMIEMVYNGYFGQGHNVNHEELKENNLFESHPYNMVYNRDEFIQILEMGDIDVQNVIINKS